MANRYGLSSRGADAGQHLQIHIDKGFDYDREVDDLRKHVGRLKTMSKAIEEERKQQGELINSLEDTMERAKLALRRATTRLNVAYKQAKSNHLLYLVLFAVALFTCVYMLAKVYRVGKAVASVAGVGGG